MAKEIYKVFTCFSFLGIVFIPYPFYSFPFQKSITSFLFKDFILLIIGHFEGLKVQNTDFSSDSLMFYALIIVLLIIAFFIHFALSFFKIYQKCLQNLIAIFQIIAIYYLALILFKYGFDKLLKIQFYLPEPNLLYTPLGQLDKDILYWSTIGSSYSYNVFLGLCEIIPALFLLHKKTRTLGAIITFGVLINVVVINFSYDISVKLFSSFLMLICVLILMPSIKTIYQFLILSKTAILHQTCGRQLIDSKSKYLISKSIIVCLIVFESLIPLMKIDTFNGDNLPKYALHGAYEVVNKQDTKNSFQNIKRVFFHKNYYIIFQLADDSFVDYHLEIEADKLIFTDYNNNKQELTYYKSSGELILKMPDSQLVLKILPWKDLPLLKPLFHWTVDEI